MNIFFLLHPKNDVAFLYDYNSMHQGLDKMCRYGYSALPVINRDGIYVGTVSEGDFLRFIIENEAYSIEEREEYSISDILRPDWNPAVNVTASMDELLLQVMEQNFLPVVDDRGCFAGIITRKDIIKYFYDLNNKNSTEQNIAV